MYIYLVGVGAWENHEKDSHEKKTRKIDRD